MRIVKGVGAVDVADSFSALRRDRRDGDLPAGLRAIDPRINGVELLMSEGVLSLHAHLDDALMPFTSLGDGLNSVATHLLSAAEARSSLLLIDELEEGLHHSVLEDVWRALVVTMRRSGGQLVVTTHSDACIAAAVAAFADQPDDLSLVGLRSTQNDVRRDRDPQRTVEAISCSGVRVADAVALDVEVR